MRWQKVIGSILPGSMSSAWKISETLVKKGASIGANATIRCGITVGEYATVGSGSVVTKNVRPHALVVGNPAHQIGWVCRCGFKLGEDGKCTECGERYDLKGWNEDV